MPYKPEPVLLPIRRARRFQNRYRLVVFFGNPDPDPNVDHCIVDCDDCPVPLPPYFHGFIVAWGREYYMATRYFKSDNKHMDMMIEAIKTPADVKRCLLKLCKCQPMKPCTRRW